MSIIEWLNGNHGAVTAIATLIIASSAIVSVWISKELAKENRLLRKASTEPEVAAFLKADSRRNHARNLVLANVGQGPAKNVMFTIRASPVQSPTDSTWMKPSGSLGWSRNHPRR